LFLGEQVEAEGLRVDTCNSGRLIRDIHRLIRVAYQATRSGHGYKSEGSFSLIATVYLLSLNYKAMASTSTIKSYKLYEYDPSLAAAALFCGLFCLTTLFHGWQSLRKRVWFLIPFIIGGVCKLVHLFGK
jgi:hypothetical protein